MDYHIDQTFKLCFDDSFTSTYPLQILISQILYKWKSDLVVKFIRESNVMETLYLLNN